MDDFAVAPERRFASIGPTSGIQPRGMIARHDSKIGERSTRRIEDNYDVVVRVGSDGFVETGQLENFVI
jgi:hypothetical protein